MGDSEIKRIIREVSDSMKKMGYDTEEDIPERLKNRIKATID